MNINTIFTLGLGLESPWKLLNHDLDTVVTPHRLDLRIEADRGSLYPCPECGKACKAHDFEDRTWRHLNFFQHHCYVTAPVPRTKCPEHGVKRVHVPWAREGSAFTMLFEAVMVTLAREMPMAALARYVGEYDKRLWRIVEHYVNQALAGLDLSKLKAVALDETACKRGQNYVTVFIDMEREKRPVIFVTPGKDKGALKRFKTHLQAHGGHAGRVAEVVCGLSGAFLAGADEHFPDAKVTADWFHVVQLFTVALDEVRRDEARTLAKREAMPKHLRFALLKRGDGKLTNQQRAALTDLETRGLETAKAYRCKETLGWIREAKTERAVLWRVTNFTSHFLSTLKEPVLEPMRRALRTLAGYKTLIVNRFRSNYSNARLEGFNGIFQAARARARGYRNTNTFMTMIYLLAAPLGDMLERMAAALNSVHKGHKPMPNPNSI